LTERSAEEQQTPRATVLDPADGLHPDDVADHYRDLERHGLLRTGPAGPEATAAAKELWPVFLAAAGWAAKHRARLVAEKPIAVVLEEVLRTSAQPLTVPVLDRLRAGPAAEDDLAAPMTAAARAQLPDQLSVLIQQELLERLPDGTLQATAPGSQLAELHDTLAYWYGQHLAPALPTSSAEPVLGHRAQAMNAPATDVPVAEGASYLDPFGLADLQPLDSACEESADVLSYYEEVAPLQAQHHGAHSFYLFLDEHSWMGDLPGPPQVLAAYVHRQRDQGRVRVEHTFQPMVPLAQRWLAERGADPAALEVASGVYARPTDRATQEAEERLRAPGRYEVLAAFTYDWEPSPSWVLALDRHRPDPNEPYRIFHRTVGPYTRNPVGFLRPYPGSAVYTVTEHGFRNLREVAAWCRITDENWTSREPGLRPALRSFTRTAIAPHTPPSSSSRSSAATTRTVVPGSGPTDPLPPPDAAGHRPGHRR
ncbi:hypothetical protein AB0E96_39995, partial [Kitasatospora sp. NPDC036755]|uniref:hypothetical protein n=1 Tax=Kitasatospora sp. NPDC036755 TaxID=3154600 RepID=UPI0033E8F978